MAERLERHPLSAIWGDMPNDQYQGLVDSIRESGDLMAEVRTLDGMVLDGWHRYRAALDAGVQPLIVPWSGDDPVGYVIKKNALRRHLTAGQRSICVARCYDWAEMGSNQHSTEGVQTLRILHEDKDEQEQDSQWSNKSADQLRDPSSVEAVGAKRNPESVFPAGADGRTADEVRAMGEAKEGLATERMAKQGERLTSRPLAEKADASKRTADDAKAIIRAGLDDAVMAKEVPFSVAAAQARGDPDKPKPPTKVELLEAERDALRLDAQEKARRIEELAREVQFLRDQSSPVEAVRERTLNSMGEEIRILEAARNRYMNESSANLRSSQYWEREAKKPCSSCGAIWGRRT